MLFYLWRNLGIITLSTYASRTIHIYWWLSDYYYIENTTLPPSCRSGSSLCWGKLLLRCWAFAWLNDCTNGDEADVAFVQTQKTQSLYCISVKSLSYKIFWYKKNLLSIALILLDWLPSLKWSQSPTKSGGSSDTSKSSSSVSILVTAVIAAFIGHSESRPNYWLCNDLVNAFTSI